MLTGRIRELSIICIKEEHEGYSVLCSMLAETRMGGPMGLISCHQLQARDAALMLFHAKMHRSHDGRYVDSNNSRSLNQPSTATSIGLSSTEPACIADMSNSSPSKHARLLNTTRLHGPLHAMNSHEKNCVFATMQGFQHVAATSSCSAANLERRCTRPCMQYSQSAR